MVDSLEVLKTFDRARAFSIPDNLHIRNELIIAAAERVYYVVIQREAMNLPCFVEFFQDYEIPDEVKARLGPRRGE